MASKDTDDGKPEGEEAEVSLDLSQAAVKRMIADAKERGYITYDQLNSVMPPDQVSSEQIEDVMAMLSEMGINIIDDEEVEEGEAPVGELVETSSTSREVAVVGATSETLDRTDDPVRMYLREMGSVELLSREGEIAIAKRIEAGRNTMIAGLCESPLTFQAIIIWRDELLSEDILLRDVIDLEATFGRSLDGEEDIVGAGLEGVDVDASAAPRRAPGAAEPELDADGNPIFAEAEEDDDEDGVSMSLAAMEAALKPQVLASLGEVEVLVNAAGTNAPNRALEVLSLEDYHDMIDANMNGAYYCVQAFLPGMRSRGSGTIVNVVSDAGKQASPKAGPAYVMSKFGLAGLTQAINAEERARGVRASALFPGDIDTPLLGKRPVVPDAVARSRMMQPEDIAACVLFCVNLPPRVIIEEILVRPR